MGVRTDCSEADHYKLGRIAVLKEERGRHYGDLIVRLLLFKSFDDGEPMRSRLDAQINASEFYKRFGFVQTGDLFLEANIEHIPMAVSADNVRYPSDCHHDA